MAAEMSTEELIMRTDPAEFHECQFWDRFYATRGGEAFEWYGSWADIAPLVDAVVGDRAAPLLVLGCGNSTLSEDMSGAGFTSVTSMDYSESVIDEMKRKTAGAVGMQWDVMDVTAMTYADGSWPLVVDKGTLDALYAENTEKLTEVARQMFSEIQRVLATGGRYVLVSMCQDFVLARVLGCFAAPAWRGRVDIQPFVPGDGTARPAYLLIFTAAASAEGGAAGAAAANVQLHGELTQELADGEAVSAEQAAAAVARYQRLGAMAAATAAVPSAGAISSAALGGATIAALPVRHDAALFAAVGRRDSDEESDDGAAAGESGDDSDDSSVGGGLGAGALSAETLAALADYAVDSGIVDAVDPRTLVDDIMGSGRAGGLLAAAQIESSDSDTSDSDEDDAAGSGVAAPAPAPQQAPAAGLPTAWVTHEDPYVRGLIVEGLARRPHWDTTVGGGVGSTGGGAVSMPPSWQAEGAARPRVRFHWGEYEEMDWDEVSRGETHSCCYCIRKGLIRKAQVRFSSLFCSRLAPFRRRFRYFSTDVRLNLAQIAFNAKKWAAKHPDSSFVKAMPETYILQLTEGAEAGRETLERLLQGQAPELLAQLTPDWEGEAEGTTADGRSLWIAKPSMTNGGAGVELVPSCGALLSSLRANPELREWVVQRYVDRPLLVDNRKFHLRVYVLCVGRLKVYVCKDVLALFSLKRYDTASLSERDAHITNTCVQNPESLDEEMRSVRMWDEIIEEISKEQGSDREVLAERVFDEVCDVVGQTFHAVSPEMTTFMALPNCFELFGFDFLLDNDFHPWLLEANAEPDFKQTGGRLQGVVRTVIEGTLALTADVWAKPPAEGWAGTEAERIADAAKGRMAEVFSR